MTRWFNVAGPCNPTDHYMLSATARLPDVMRLIAQKSYFVLHAPRQTGKTTAMLTLAQELTASGQYVAALLSLEVGAPFSDHPEAAEAAVLGAWRSAYTAVSQLRSNRPNGQLRLLAHVFVRRSAHGHNRHPGLSCCSWTRLTPCRMRPSFRYSVNYGMDFRIVRRRFHTRWR